MSHATHWGFNGPPLGATCLCSSPPDPPWLKGALVGVLKSPLPLASRPRRTAPGRRRPGPRLAFGVGSRRPPSRLTCPRRSASLRSDPRRRLSRPDASLRSAWAIRAAPGAEPGCPARPALPVPFRCRRGRQQARAGRVGEGRQRPKLEGSPIPRHTRARPGLQDSPESSSKESCDVLHDDVAGSKLANETRVLAPKTRACPVDPGSLAGEADVLAGEAAAEDVDWWHRHGHKRPDHPHPSDPSSRPGFAAAFRPPRPSCAFGVGHKGAHVGVARDSGPMSSEDTPAELVLLALPHNAHTGPLEAEVEAADAGEEAMPSTGADGDRRGAGRG
jgi:hypothetical protein